MYKKSKIGLMVSAAFMLAPISQGQENATDGVDVEKIQVTGSRIKRTYMEGPVPIAVITSADIAASGSLNV